MVQCLVPCPFSASGRVPLPHRSTARHRTRLPRLDDLSVVADATVLQFLDTALAVLLQLAQVLLVLGEVGGVVSLPSRLWGVRSRHNAEDPPTVITSESRVPGSRTCSSTAATYDTTPSVRLHQYDTSDTIQRPTSPSSTSTTRPAETPEGPSSRPLVGSVHEAGVGRKAEHRRPTPRGGGSRGGSPGGGGSALFSLRQASQRTSTKWGSRPGR